MKLANKLALTACTALLGVCYALHNKSIKIEFESNDDKDGYDCEDRPLVFVYMPDPEYGEYSAEECKNIYDKVQDLVGEDVQILGSGSDVDEEQGGGKLGRVGSDICVAGMCDYVAFPKNVKADKYYCLVHELVKQSGAKCIYY